jgi:hypothetical protein
MSLSQEEKDEVLAIKAPQEASVMVTRSQLAKVWDEHMEWEGYIGLAAESFAFERFCKAIGLSK